jgi:uncharacterized membrane protein
MIEIDKTSPTHSSPADLLNHSKPNDSTSNATSPLMVKRQISTSFKGPIPPPEILAGYEQIKIGYAERIFLMAESENIHRREIENKELNANIEIIKRRDNEARLGQIFAFLIALSAIGGGVYATIHGSPIAGSVISTTGLVSIVGALIYGRKSDLTNQIEKDSK